MQSYQGKSVYKGIAMGPVVVLKKNDYQVKRTRIEDPVYRPAYRAWQPRRLCPFPRGALGAGHPRYHGVQIGRAHV